MTDFAKFMTIPIVLVSEIAPFVPGFDQSMVNYSMPYSVTDDGMALITAQLSIYRVASENSLLSEYRGEAARSARTLCKFLNLATSAPCRNAFIPINSKSPDFQYAGSRTVTETIRNIGQAYSSYSDFMHMEIQSSRMLAFSEEGVDFLWLRLQEFVRDKILMPRLSAVLEVTKDLLFLICEYV